MGPLVTCVILVLVVWDLLLLGRLVAPWIGAGAATLLSFLLATGLVVGARPRPSAGRGGCVGPLLLGAVAGYAGYPAWVALIATLGLALGLAPRASAPPGASIAVVVATVTLAPIFEEILYRERLLLALRVPAGTPLAIAIASLLFALPHVEAWSVLGTFLVGLALGAMRVLVGSISLCIGIHAGLNLASVAWSRG